MKVDKTFINLYQPSSTLLFLKHFQHPVGDDEAADHVERAEQNGEKTQREREVIVAFGVPHHDDGADDDDPVNRVRARHKRGVQDGRHVRNHLDAQEDGQDDDVDKGLIFKKKF